ncbi:cell growth regulator with RING finger domain protein 1-like isoform X2 [Watersipora subatra]|uniref:cell growth regulator with RING finger domain protein 1-like isoform X2 n=1 Tax=Watersipora subatra TaxID=2589382 RepID=UPI00355C6103
MVVLLWRSDDRKQLSIISLTTHWRVHTYKDIAISTVLTDMLQSCSNEDYLRLLEDCDSQANNVTEYDSPETHTIQLSPRESSVDRSEPRATYPLVLAATDAQKTLLCLVHIADNAVPTSYIIAQFYRDPSGIFHRLTNLFTSSSEVEEECSVCLTNTASCFVLPCRHKCICDSCVQRLQYCPVCRAHICSYANTQAAQHSEL